MSYEELLAYLSSIDFWLMFQNNAKDLFIYVAEDIETPQQINPGEKREILNKQEVGKLDAVSFTTTSKKLKIIIEVDDKKIIGTPEELYNAGLIGYNQNTFWLSVYDDESTPNRFVMWFTPARPKEYYGHFKVTIINEDSKPAFWSGSIYRYKLKDEYARYFLGV